MKLLFLTTGDAEYIDTEECDLNGFLEDFTSTHESDDIEIYDITNLKPYKLEFTIKGLENAFD